MMQWKQELNENWEKVLTSEREGIKFEIIIPSYGKSYIAFVDKTKAGFASKRLEDVKQWCQDFEYCYECRESPVHADKLCFDCYFK